MQRQGVQYGAAGQGASRERRVPPPGLMSALTWWGRTLAAMIDRRAVVVGVLPAVAIALPVAVIGQWVVDDGDSASLVLIFLLPVLAGFAVGGYVAARRTPEAPLANGAVAALVAFAVIQGFGIARRLATGLPLSIPSLALAAFLACSCGLLGGLVAQHRRRLPEPDTVP